MISYVVLLTFVLPVLYGSTVLFCAVVSMVDMQ